MPADKSRLNLAELRCFGPQNDLAVPESRAVAGAVPSSTSALRDDVAECAGEATREALTSTSPVGRQTADEVPSCDQPQAVVLAALGLELGAGLASQETGKSNSAGGIADASRASMGPGPGAWRDLPAPNPWCPEELRRENDILAAHRYFDNQSILHDSPALLWQAFGATRRGRSHANNGSHREDALQYEAGERFAVAIVSDGAGSSQLSRIGSQLACAQGVAAVRNMLGQLPTDIGEQPLARQLHDIIGKAIRSICNNLAQLASVADVLPREFNCTFLIAVGFRSDHSELLAVTQVGDGFIAIERTDAEIVYPCEPDAGGMSGEVSCFLPSADAPDRALTKLKLYNAKNVTRILLATDGIEDVFYPPHKRVPLLLRQLDTGVDEPAEGFRFQPRHGPVFGSEQPQTLLATWLGYEMRGENDDRTLLVMHRGREG